MKLLIDMNLSPAWCGVLGKHGHTCFHWSQVGQPGASDAHVIAWAHENGCVVLTHDLDFGAILAVTQESGPSVVQVRTQDVLPERMETLLVEMLDRYQAELSEGALVVVDEAKSRVRILPLKR